MSAKHALTGDERGFLTRVSCVAYSNPFSAARARVHAELLPDPRVMDDRLALAREIMRRMARFDSDRLAMLGDFEAGDRALIEGAFLYLVYHRFLDELDQLIGRQAGRERSVEVPFHAEYFDLMTARGFSEDMAVRYLGFFFQLRRAFHFILESLVGQSRSMWRLREALWSNVFTHDMRGFAVSMWNRMEDFSTLLLGETGTGKGSAGAAIGRSSFIPYLPETRRFAVSFSNTFVSLNLSQFPETLIESELFGHRKGAFTGAVENHDGVLARCNEHGALFLDEVGEVSVPIQIKLLRVLQERAFVPLGGHDSLRFEGRVIAATNQGLEELRESGRFRDDFYYRLCSDTIVVPTLRERVRERPEELDELVAVVVERMVGEARESLVAETVAVLRRELPTDYAWPGNVRELEQAVRRIALTGHYAASTPRAPRDLEERFVASVRDGALSASELVGQYCVMLYARHPVYAEVAVRTGLDRRTVRKHVLRFTDARRDD